MEDRDGLHSCQRDGQVPNCVAADTSQGDGGNEPTDGKCNKKKKKTRRNLKKKSGKDTTDYNPESDLFTPDEINQFLDNALEDQDEADLFNGKLSYNSDDYEDAGDPTWVPSEDEVDTDGSQDYQDQVHVDE